MARPKKAGKRFADVSEHITPGDYEEIRDWITETGEGKCAVIRQYYENPNPSPGDESVCPLPNPMNAGGETGDDPRPARYGYALTFARRGWRQGLEEEFGEMGRLDSPALAGAAAECERARMSVLVDFLQADEQGGLAEIQGCDLIPDHPSPPVRKPTKPTT